MSQIRLKLVPKLAQSFPKFSESCLKVVSIFSTRGRGDRFAQKTLFGFVNVQYARSNNLKVKIANGPSSIQCRKLHGLAAIESDSPTKFSD